MRAEDVEVGRAYQLRHLGNYRVIVTDVELHLYDEGRVWVTMPDPSHAAAYRLPGIGEPFPVNSDDLVQPWEDWLREAQAKREQRDRVVAALFELGIETHQASWRGYTREEPWFLTVAVDDLETLLKKVSDE